MPILLKIKALGRWCGKNVGILIVLGLMVFALISLLNYLGDAKPLSELRDAVKERADAGKLPTEMQVRGTGHYWASLGNAILLALLIIVKGFRKRSRPQAPQRKI